MKLFTRIKKTIYIGLGVLMLVIGIIGIVVPVLPTTPFLLVASYLFVRHSKKMHQWLIGNKVLGTYIYNYETYRAINRKTKVRAVILLWVSLGFSIYLVENLHLKAMLLLIGILVSIHILRIKTLEDVIEKRSIDDLKVETDKIR